MSQCLNLSLPILGELMSDDTCTAPMSHQFPRTPQRLYIDVTSVLKGNVDMDIMI